MDSKMKITDIPEYKDKEKLLALEENTMVSEAAKLMKENNYGATVVLNEGKLSGIFTERDLLVKIVAEGKDYNKLKLKDVMTKDVKTAKENDEVMASVRRMSNGKFRHLPIMDDNDRVVGMISQGDFVAATWAQLFFRLKEQTKASFISYTQLWILAICILLYVTVLLFIS